MLNSAGNDGKLRLYNNFAEMVFSKSQISIRIQQQRQQQHVSHIAVKVEGLRLPESENFFSVRSLECHAITCIVFKQLLVPAKQQVKLVVPDTRRP